MIVGCSEGKRQVAGDSWEGLLVCMTLDVWQELLITVARVLLTYILRILINHDIY